MNNAWFRMYGDVINDPKVMRLPEAMRWHWVSVLCVASKNDGMLPSATDLAFQLRTTAQRVAAIVAELVAAGLVDKLEGGGFKPHNWDGRQYKSDNSTGRVQRYREKRAAAGLPVTWTAPKKLKAAVYERDGHQCVYCGSLDDLSIDHKTPQSRGGTDDMDNLQTLCRPCNASKRDMTHEEFVSRNGNETFQKRYRAEAEQKTEQSTAEPRADQMDLVEESLRIDLQEIFGGAFVDLSRARTWLERGYDPGMIREVVREIRQRKPDVASLAYFDGALAERHKARAPTPSEREGYAAVTNFEKVVGMFAKSGIWSKYAGPEPGQIGCRAPAEILVKHGIDPATGEKLRKAG